MSLEVRSPSLGPLDEIIDDGDDEAEDEQDDDDEEEESEHIYSSVVKVPRDRETSVDTNDSRRQPRFTSVLRSSRIMRRHTTYYNAKQFDSLPPQATMSLSTASSSSFSRKPHVHSWHHRHGNRDSSTSNSNNTSSLQQVGTQCVPYLPCNVYFQDKTSQLGLGTLQENTDLQAF